MRLRVLIPLIGGLIACRDVQGPNDWWLVTTSVAAAEFSAGTAVTITIIARNTSSEVRSVWNHGGCTALYRLRMSDGTELSLPYRFCTLEALAPTNVAPGDSVIRTDTWNGKIRVTPENTEVAAPPGDYQVTGRVFVPEEVHGSTAAVRLK